MANTAYLLSADAGIRDITELWGEIRARIESADAVLEIDASAVARPDTALVQLLAVAVARSREQGKTVRLLHSSQRLRDLISLLALDVVLGK